MYIHLSVTQFTVLPYRLLSSALTKPLSIIRHSVCIFICIIYQYVLGSSALALFFSNLSAHSIPRLLINHPLLKQPFIKVLEPYRLRHFSFLHLRAHLRHAPINRLTVLCQAFHVYLHVCASVICYYPTIYTRPLWVYGKQNFYAAKNTVEHRNVGTHLFSQLFSVLTYFVKFAMSTKKEQSNRPVRLLCSIRFSILDTASVPREPVG